MLERRQSMRPGFTFAKPGAMQVVLKSFIVALLISLCVARREEICPSAPINMRAPLPIAEGETVYRDIQRNESHRWYYSNYNMTTMSLPMQLRKLIINLEPCKGTVFLFVRKTRSCYPDPYSCINVRVGAENRNISRCGRSHYVSEINGSRDGGPTFFEVPLTSTQWFITVYAVEEAAYTLTFLSDIGAFPRPGTSGNILGRQLTENTMQLSWNEAFYRPQGITSTYQYWIYVAKLIDQDTNYTSRVVFLRKDKVMNTVCGLQNNTDTHYAKVSSDLCSFGTCNATVSPIEPGQRYVFNIVVESARGFKCAYGGLVAGTEWQITESLADESTLQAAGVVSGSILAVMVLSIGIMMSITA